MEHPKRKPWSLVALVALAILAVALLVWQARIPHGVPAGPRPRTPAGTPDGLVLEASFGGGAAMLATLRDRLDVPLARAVLPRRPGELFERMCELPQALVAGVADDAPLQLLLLRGADDDVHWAIAARLRPGAAVPAALAATALPADAALDGARWIGAAPLPGDVATATVDDAIACADDAPTLVHAMAYLVTTRLPREAPAGLALHVPDRVVAVALRGAADRAVRDTAASLEDAARQERSRHAAPPALGEPEALVALIRDALTERTALLSDVGAVDAQLVVGADGALELDVQATVRPGSTLARQVGQPPGAQPSILGVVPPGTALAWATSVPEPERGETLRAIRDAVPSLAGDRIDPRGRELATAALDAIASCRGSASLFALGASTSGAFATWATWPTREASPPADAVVAALGASWISDVGGAALGCDPRLAPAPLARLVTPDRASLLCPGVPADAERRPRLTISARTLESQTPPAASVHVWALEQLASPDAVSVAPPLATALAAGTPPAADPDLSRSLSSLPAQAIFVARLSPARVLRATTLLAIPAIRRAAASDAAHGAGPDATIVLAAAARPGGALALRVVAPPSALAPLVSLLGVR